jgi:hypothetical protein
MATDASAALWPIQRQRRLRRAAHHHCLPVALFPSSAKHFLKKSCSERPFPFALPAAGFPISRGGYALAVKASHFLATSTLTAKALSAAATRPSVARSRILYSSFDNIGHVPTTLQTILAAAVALLDRGHAKISDRESARRV